MMPFFQKIAITLCLLQIGCAGLNATHPQQTAAEVDARGYVNPWALQKTLNDIEAMPEVYCSSDQDVSTEGLTEAEIAKIKQKEKAAFDQCNKKQTAQEQAYQDAVSRLNATWLPLLKQATDNGDPVAEVILRMCETAPLLNRENVAADCTKNEQARNYAQKRLETIGFEPALYHYKFPNLRGYPYDLFGKYCEEKRGTDGGNLCRNKLTNARYEQMFAVMQTGVLSVLERLDCEYDIAGTDDGKQAFATCLYYSDLMRAVTILAPKFFVAPPDHGGYDTFSLMRTHTKQGFEPWLQGAADYRNFAPLKPRISPIKWAEKTDPEYEAKFYGQAYRILKKMSANIQLNLDQEPRWAVFILERGNPVATRPTGNKSRQEKFFGTYQGSLISVGTSRVITKLFLGSQGNIVGRYMMIYSGDLKVEMGSLSPCMPLENDNLLCRWRDKFGQGFVSMYFDKTGNSFKGMWLSNLHDSDGYYTLGSFPRRGPYLKDDITTWNGTRQQ